MNSLKLAGWLDIHLFRREYIYTRLAQRNTSCSGISVIPCVLGLLINQPENAVSLLLRYIIRGYANGEWKF